MTWLIAFWALTIELEKAPGIGGAAVPLCPIPFILVKAPSGELRNLDVRRYRLARLDRAHALAAWRAHKKNRHKRERA